MNYLYVLLIFLLTIFTAFGDSLIKKAGQPKDTNIIYLLTGLAVYCATGIIWFFIYKKTEFSTVGSIYGVATVLVFALVGVFYFKETVTLVEFVGMVMAVASILILSKFAA